MHKLFFCLLIVLSAEMSVFACMCSGDTPSVREALNKAKVVFLGKAVSSEYHKGAVFPNGNNAGEELAILFKVQDWWKGEAAEQIAIFTEQYRAPDQTISISTCGMEYIIGKVYLVYAVEYPVEGKLRTALCSRTTKLENAKKDLQKLGKGYKHKTANIN